MTWDEFDTWSEHSLEGFAAQQVASGLHSGAEATAYAREQLAELLPAGLATPLHLLRTVVEPAAGNAVVGWLWLRVRPSPGEVEAYVFDVEVAEHARGRGMGRATMLAAEQAARDLAADVVRLTVFGHNTAARALYDSLGYVVTTAFVTKTLDGEEPAAHAEDPRSRAALEAAERRAREQGAHSLGVTLHGCDEADRALYDSAGYVLTAQLRAKSL